LKRERSIIVIGQPAEGGLRDSLVAGFIDAGCIVDVVDLVSPTAEKLTAAATWWPPLGMPLRRVFRRRVDALEGQGGNADLVVVIKGTFLDRTAIGHIRTRFECPVGCWNPDSPFDEAISNRGAGIARAIPCYDFYVTWAEDIAEQLVRLRDHVYVIPFAWDPHVIQPMAGDGTAAGRIVFVGTGTSERAEMIGQLKPLRPVVFGTRWHPIEGVEIRPPVLGREMCKVIGEAAWNINLLRPQNTRSHNMRTFEVPGAAGLQAAPDTPDHRRFLARDAGTVLFSSFAELFDILRRESVCPVRGASFLEGHAYADRARQLLTEVGLQ
jgi:hypothetical protein